MRTLAVYGDYRYSYTAVVERQIKFRQGRESTKDLHHPGPVRVTVLDDTYKNWKLLYAPTGA